MVLCRLSSRSHRNSICALRYSQKGHKDSFAMWKFIGIAAAIGFLIEISWMFLGFLMFNAPNGSVANLYYLGGEIVCPIFPVNSRFDLYGLLVNPLLYGAVAWI